MGRFPIQVVLSKCLKGFIVSEVNSEPEQARGPKLCNVEASNETSITLLTDGILQLFRSKYLGRYQITILDSK